MRWLVLIALTCAGCSLDFDALERGRRDAGNDIDARVPVPDRGDAATIDAAPDDGGGSDDGGPAGDDAGAQDGGGAACPATVDCAMPACAGARCDDGRQCTENDVCTAGVCTGTSVVCATDGCSTQVCTEGMGCHATGSAPDATPCGVGGRCCFGRCSMLDDSANCAGCGLGCDEYTCTDALPYACVCDTNAGCPLGQTCSGGRCVCSSASQCATGQACVSGHCTY